VRLDPRLLSALERALGFCRWSQGAHGPLGGNLYGLWGVRDPVYARPPRDVLQAEVEKADCGRLAVDRDTGTAQLAAGSRVDLWGFRRGLAVDRAVEVLREAGAPEGWVEIGTVTRAFGPGPDGRGWPARANPTGREETEQRILLHDRALAMVSDRDPIEIAGDAYPRYIDQRNGLPSRQAMAVFTVTELAIDAEGLAVTLFVVNQRLGEYRVGLLEPRPSVLWMLGSGEGIPLTVSRHWAKLENW
jgi:thiamine biosynthesis lipoprotein